MKFDIPFIGIATFLITSCGSSDLDINPSISNEPSPSIQELATGTVVKVVNGTTIDVKINGTVSRIRYIGVEVPSDISVAGESSLSSKALKYNQFLVGGKSVQLERAKPNTDEYGHLLRYVYLNGEMVNLALLTNGYANVANFPTEFERKLAFNIAEASAKQENVGFWKTKSKDSKEAGNVSSEPFAGGSLPALPSDKVVQCDFSGSQEARIKGNVNSKTGERIYHVPGGIFYMVTEVNTDHGDRWFCREGDAINAGWSKSAH